MTSEAIQDEGDMALNALLNSVDAPLKPEHRERARRLAARHFGAGGNDLPGGLLPEGAIVGTYRVERVLGMGGQAVVYLGRHVRLQSRLVAIKIPHGTEVTRMLREADVMARLDHPGVVGIVDLDAEASPPYLVLDYCVGGSLADRLEAEGPLPEDEVIRISRSLLRALAFAHGHEVVHRDLKPENVLFDSSGNPRIADFGLGKVVAEQVSLSLSNASRTGVAGTPLYMAPEQERPGAAVDGRTDLYGLGKLIYHMLTGEPPRTLRPVEHARTDLAHPWSELVFKLTETFPEARFRGALEVLEVLDEWAPEANPEEPRGEASVLPGGTRWWFEAIDHKGEKINDRVGAGDREEAIERIKSRGLFPTRVWAEGSEPPGLKAKAERLVDKALERPAWGLAALAVVGGAVLTLFGQPAGVIAIILGAVLGFHTSDQEHDERKKAIEALNPPKARRTRGSISSFITGLLSGVGFVACFLTTMGGTIALYLSEGPNGLGREVGMGGEVALIVSGFLLIGSMLLAAVSRWLRHPVAAPVPPQPAPVKVLAGPSPADPFAAPKQVGGPIVAQPLPRQELPKRPTGDDPLPRA